MPPLPLFSDIYVHYKCNWYSLLYRHERVEIGWGDKFSLDAAIVNVGDEPCYIYVCYYDEESGEELGCKVSESPVNPDSTEILSMEFKMPRKDRWDLIAETGYVEGDTWYRTARVGITLYGVPREEEVIITIPEALKYIIPAIIGATITILIITKRK